MASFGVLDGRGEEGEPVTAKLSRRDVLKSLAMSAAATSVLRVIPAQAAEYAHHMIAAEKAATPAKGYTPKFFRAHDYKTLQTLCQTIFPADADSGGAIEAGAPEFIDLLTSENQDYQRILGGGIMWLDNTCSDRYDKVYLDCSPEQQKETLDKLAYRKNAAGDAFLSQARRLQPEAIRMLFTGYADIQAVINAVNGRTVLTGTSPYDGMETTTVLDDQHRPERVTVKANGHVYGAAFADYRDTWEPAYLVIFPSRITWTIDGRPLADLRVTAFKSNPYVVFPTPAVVRQAVSKAVSN